ncbi:hypothetical protein MKW98_026153, partial [Papaver atlanticum]
DVKYVFVERRNWSWNGNWCTNTFSYIFCCYCSTQQSSVLARKVTMHKFIWGILSCMFCGALSKVLYSHSCSSLIPLSLVFVSMSYHAYLYLSSKLLTSIEIHCSVRE